MIHQLHEPTSIQEWLASNVDVTDTLLVSDVFEYRELSNGTKVLIFVGPVTVEHMENASPVDLIYATSPNEDRIIILSPAQDHRLGLFGYSNQLERLILFLNILESIEY